MIDPFFLFAAPAGMGWAGVCMMCGRQPAPPPPGALKNRLFGGNKRYSRHNSRRNQNMVYNEQECFGLEAVQIYVVWPLVNAHALNIICSN